MISSVKIFLATCDEKLNGTDDDRLLRDQLVSRGIDTEFKSWTDAGVAWNEAHHVLIRSTWDYHRRLPDFLSWAERIDGVTTLSNPFQLIKWNASKRYLLDLHDKGVPTIPSIFTSQNESALNSLNEMLQNHTEVIIKPAVSGTAELTFRFVDMRNAEDVVNKVLARGECLIQPFISSISTTGELSLVYFNDRGHQQFSHAVQKLPTFGDFRVQSDFGGTVTPISVPVDLVDLGLGCLEALPLQPLYSRIDIVDWKVSPQIGEIELIEPELFFGCSESSAPSFADILVSPRD
jgi:hypothetical protein